jgi:hypothetical protein
MVSFYACPSLSASLTFAFKAVVGQNGLGAFVLQPADTVGFEAIGVAQAWRVAPVQGCWFQNLSDSAGQSLGV